MTHFMKMIGISLLAMFLGTIALYAAYSLPTDTIYRHVQKDREIFSNEGTSWTWAKKSPSRLDGFTDSIMLMNAAYPVDSILISAMKVLKWEDKASPDKILLKALESKEQAETLGSLSYYRYWHGYLVYLKPILFISSYHDFRMMNAYLQLFLIAMALILFYQKLGVFHTIAFLLIVCFINPVTTAMSLQLSAIFYIVLFSVIIIILKNDWLYGHKLYIYFFQIIGIATAYFDLLTYPVAAVGIPLLVYILLNRRNLDTNKNIILSTIYNACAWGFGYVTMWVGKCLVIWVTFGYSILPDIIDSVKRRSSGEMNWEFVGHEPVDFTTVLHANFKAAAEGPWIYIFLIFMIYIVYRILKKSFKNNYFNAKPYAIDWSIVIVGIFPIVWYSLTLNHSYVHAGFLAFRDLAVFFYAIICILIDFSSDSKLNKS